MKFKSGLEIDTNTTKNTKTDFNDVLLKMANVFYLRKLLPSDQ